VTADPKTLARLALHQMGILRAISWRHRHEFQVLTYHRFVGANGVDPAEALRRQCVYIRQYFHPVSMAQVERALHGGAKLPPNALAITVDDGYRDFLSVAFPVFREYELPVTVYLISGFLDGELWPWWDRLEYAVQRTTRSYVELAPGSRNGARQLSLQSAADKSTSYQEMCTALVKVPNRERLSFLECVPEKFAVDIPAAAPAEYAALKWDEVRMMSHAEIEFGAHSRTHPILPSLEEERSIHAELADSKRRIEEELRSPVLHFCYPNGDFDDRVLEAVKACGFRSAATVLAGYNSLRTDPYLLKRRSVDPELPEAYFRETLSGLH
jgi:peptidoglycan/xylan/chitin deacetylase (PgdA/CDA1 family)